MASFLGVERRGGVSCAYMRTGPEGTLSGFSKGGVLLDITLYLSTLTLFLWHILILSIALFYWSPAGWLLTICYFTIS